MYKGVEFAQDFAYFFNDDNRRALSGGGHLLRPAMHFGRHGPCEATTDVTPVHKAMQQSRHDGTIECFSVGGERSRHV